MFKLEDNQNILIIGMAGGLARITAGLISKKYPNVNITGVDSRAIKESVKRDNIEYKKIKYTRGNFEKLFREKNFDVVFHLARMSHAKTSPMQTISQRLDLNIVGTKRILDLSLKFCVKKVVILSTYHVYGALSDNPVFIPEDSSLRASINHPELRDVVEMDQLSTNWMWKNQTEVETVVLRPCTIIGPQINNTMTQYLTTQYAPICMDFNPMFQFIHEYDMARVLMSSLDELPTGIYNIASDDVISLKQARKYLKMKNAPVPGFALELTSKLTSTLLWSFPRYLIDYIKFSCIIDPTAFQAQVPDYKFEFSVPEALELLKLD